MDQYNPIPYFNESIITHIHKQEYRQRG